MHIYMCVCVCVYILYIYIYIYIVRPYMNHKDPKSLANKFVSKKIYLKTPKNYNILSFNIWRQGDNILDFLKVKAKESKLLSYRTTLATAI